MAIVFYFDADVAHVQHSTKAPVIAVKPFERGYYPIFTHRKAEELNAGKYSQEVLDSALLASYCGWNAPGARLAVRWVELQEEQVARAGEAA